MSADDGWVLGRDGGGTDTVLFHTLDGGRTWSREPGGATGSNAGGEAIGFANADFGWRQQFATGSNGPYTLEVTRDAGASWSLLPSVDAHGGCEFAPVVFADPRVAFAAEPMTDAAGGLFAPWVWRSTNGGASWSHMALARPAWLKGRRPSTVAAVLCRHRCAAGVVHRTVFDLARLLPQHGLGAQLAPSSCRGHPKRPESRGGGHWVVRIPTAAGSPPAVAIAPTNLVGGRLAPWELGRLGDEKCRGFLGFVNTGRRRHVALRAQRVCHVLSSIGRSESLDDAQLGGAGPDRRRRAHMVSA